MHAPLTFFATTYPPFFARNPVLWRSSVWAVCSRKRSQSKWVALFAPFQPSVFLLPIRSASHPAVQKRRPNIRLRFLAHEHLLGL